MTEHEIDCGCEEYNELTRRQFIAASAGVSAAAMFPAWLPKIVMSKNYSSTRDIIVSVFQRGGADGLSIAVPFADPNYYTSRSTIAIPRPDSTSSSRGIALDNFFMFPQAMAGGTLAGTGGLMPAFQAQDLLIVHATGQLNNSRSHFDAQRYMEVGKPVDPSLVTGWLGRHLLSIPPLVPTAPLRGIGLSSGLQKTLVGGPLTLPIADPSNFSIGGSATTQASRLSVIQGDYVGADDPVGSSALSATNTIGLLKSVNFAGYAPANGAVYPTSSFGRALRSVAVLIKNNVGIEAAAVDVGNWDTHSGQDPIAGSMQKTMLDFSNALGAFYADIIATGLPVTVVVVSEFGRNVRENGSAGTDHGRGTTMFAMGKGIVGGRVITKGPWPGLAHENLDSGQDLKVTVDYRDILAEIVQNRLGNPNLGFVFPSWNMVPLGVTR
jgi:uncharacterized protein (DUF1501 family)